MGATAPIPARPKGHAYLDLEDDRAADLVMQLHGESFFDSAKGTIRAFKEAKVTAMPAAKKKADKAAKSTDHAKLKEEKEKEEKEKKEREEKEKKEKEKA